MPRSRRDWIGQRSGFLEVVAIEKSRRGESGKLTTMLRCACNSGLPGCTREIIIRSENFARTQSCGCVKQQGKVSNPEWGERERPLRERFTDEEIAEVRDLRQQGELKERLEEEGGSYRTNRMPFEEIAYRTGLDEKDVVDICRPIEQRAGAETRARKEVEDAIWQASVARKLQFDENTGRCIVPEGAEARDAKDVNRRFAALANAFLGVGVGEYQQPNTYEPYLTRWKRERAKREPETGGIIDRN